MTTLLQAAGATDEKQPRFAPIFCSRFFYGLWTNRSPLRSPAGVIYSEFYKIGSTDALIAGSNIELSNRLTLCRRPGHTAGLAPFISGVNVPGIIDSFYSFQEIGGTVRVFADTPGSIYLVGGYQNGAGTASQGIIPIFTKQADAGQSYFQGVNQALYFSDSITANTNDTQKWLDFGIGQAGNSFTTITASVFLGTYATITAENNYAVGQTVVISGTTNGGGELNGTWVITARNNQQFQFAFAGSTFFDYAPDQGFASATWNLGIVAPKTAPVLNIVASGSAATVWEESTAYSTMGLIVDSGTGTVQSLTSVNALGGNATEYGTSGNGNPPWDQTPGGTTSDNGITWTNWGPVAAWGAGKTWNNLSVGGSTANPAVIYVPATASIWGNVAAGLAQGISGLNMPDFKGGQGAIVYDTHTGAGVNAKWVNMGPIGLWASGQTYIAFGHGNANATCAVVEPVLLPTTQTVYLQVSTAGTSGTSYTPPFQTTAGAQANDNELTWTSQGSSTWTAATSYTAWSVTQPVFGVVEDSNGNMQVCVTTGSSGATEPLPEWVANNAYTAGQQIVDSNGFVQKVTTGGTSGKAKTLSHSALTSGIATYTSNAHGFSAGQYVTITGSTSNAAYNVVDAIIHTVTTNTFTVLIAHDNIAGASDTGTAYGGPTWATAVSGTTADGSTLVWTNQGSAGTGGRPFGWGVNYGQQTQDGTVVWVCVGPPITWAASTQWYLPTAGFIPPSATDPYGSAQVIGSAYVQAVISSGESDPSTQPTWSTTVGNFVLDPSTDNNEIEWKNVGAYTAASLAWTTGYGYVYAFKARSATDLYSTLALGGGGVLLGESASTPSPLVNQGTAPTGSADGSVSTASPSVQMAPGTNAGSVVYISGLGSTDPQVDTISIFRTFDGGATYFWLTDIAAPAPINGNAQPWTYADTLPDVANATSSGLNTLVTAPIDHSNDPPLPGAVNLTQYFGRTWYSVGSTVYCSQGPNIGGPSQPPGNGYTAFNPGQFFTFASPVSRLVPNTVGLLVFTTSDLGIVSGGPAITSMFPNIYLPGLGLTSYNALSIRGGLIDLFTADNQVITLDPNMGASKTGYPIGDQFIKYGAQTTTYSPSTAYLAYHIQGLNDDALYVADGSTGWFRCVTSLAPDSAITGPVWSPKASIVGGAKAIASLEVAPGQHALLVGSTSANSPILVRDSTYSTFTDNNVAYNANFTIGSIVLANPGQLAELNFATCEFIKTGNSPKLSVMLDEIQDCNLSIYEAQQNGGQTTYYYTRPFGFILQDSSGQLWEMQVNDLGLLTTTQIAAGTVTTVIFNNPANTNSWQVGVTTIGQLTTTAIFAGIYPTGIPMASSTGNTAWTIGVTTLGLLTTNQIAVTPFSLPPVVGAGLTISGMSNTGNNGVFTVVSLGAGTFTVNNPNGVSAFNQTGTTTLFEDLSSYITNTGLPPQDAPLRYGTTLQPLSTYSNRYYFAQSVGINQVTPPQGTFCRHLQMKVNFGNDEQQNEILTSTLFGQHWSEI